MFAQFLLTLKFDVLIFHRKLFSVLFQVTIYILSFKKIDRVTTKIMASNQNVLAVLVGLISSLVACVQLNVAMSTVHLNYVKQRFDIPRVLLVSDGRIARYKHLKRAGRQPRPLKFYILPYSIHMFSRSSTSLSVQKKQSDLLLSFFLCSAFAVACCKQ